MAKKISSLSVVLGATVAPFVSAFSRARNAVASFSAKIKSAGMSVIRFTGIASALSAVLGGLGFGNLVKGQMDAIDANAKLADRLGLTTEALAGLQHAADLSGVSSEQLTGAFEKMLNAVGSAAAGEAGAVRAFENIGLSVAELSAMSPEDAFKTISDALSAIENPAMRAAAAQDIFGKAGQSLLPVLAEGSEGLAAMQKEAAELGLTFSRVDAARVEEANDAFSRAKSAVVGVARTVAAVIAPFITKIADALTGVGKRVVAFVNQIRPQIESVIWGLWSAASQLLSALNIGGALRSIYQAVVTFLQPVVDYVRANGQKILESAITYWYGVYDVISAVLGFVGMVVSTAAQAISDVFNWALRQMGIEASSNGETTTSAFGRVADMALFLQQVVGTALSVAAYYIRNLRTVSEWVGTSIAAVLIRIGNIFAYWFTKVIPTYLQYFSDNFSRLVEDAFNLAYTRAKNGIRNFARIIANLPGLISGEVSFGDVWRPLAEGFEATADSLPKIADRIPGELEKAMDAEAGRLGQLLKDGLGEALEGSTRDAKGAASRIAGAFEIPTIDLPDIDLASPIKAAKESTDDLGESMDKVGESVRKIGGDIPLIVAGSAEAMQAQAMAAMRTSEATVTAVNNVQPVSRAAAQPNKTQPDTMAKMLEVLRTIATNTGNANLVNLVEAA